MANAIPAGRRLIERGRGASDDVADALSDVRDSLDDFLAQADGLLARFDRRRRPSLKLSLVAVAVAGIVGGYLIGRSRAEPEPPPANGTPSAAEPSMEVATAVEVSRPQPAELDEIVPPSDGDGEPAEPAASKAGNGAKCSKS